MTAAILVVPDNPQLYYIEPAEQLKSNAMDRRSSSYESSHHVISFRDAQATSVDIERLLPTPCRQQPLRRPTSGLHTSRIFRLPAVFVPGITIIEVFFYICQVIIVDQSPHLHHRRPSNYVAPSNSMPEVHSSNDELFPVPLKRLPTDHQMSLAVDSLPLAFPFPSSMAAAGLPSSSRRRLRRVPAPVGHARASWSPTAVSSLLAYRSDRRHEVWRYAMYMFVHAGWQHLLLNACIQLVAGIPLEVIHGAVRTGLIYMTGVLAGSLATSVFDPDVVLVGSSSGVYALVAAHLPSVLLNYADIELGKLKLITICVVAFAEVGLSVRGSSRSSYGVPPLSSPASRPAPSRTASVSYVAHLTGAVAGLLTGLLVLGPSSRRRRRVDAASDATTNSCCRK